MCLSDRTLECKTSPMVVKIADIFCIQGEIQTNLYQEEVENDARNETINHETDFQRSKFPSAAKNRFTVDRDETKSRENERHENERKHRRKIVRNNSTEHVNSCVSVVGEITEKIPKQFNLES